MEYKANISFTLEGVEDFYDEDERKYFEKCLKDRTMIEFDSDIIDCISSEIIYEVKGEKE